jgi:membrane-bound lytic murein transglycosylase A
MTTVGGLLQHRLGLIAVVAFAATSIASAGRAEDRPAVKIPNSQLMPVAWHEIDGWADDDHAAAFAAFMMSCKAILRGSSKQAGRALFSALQDACGKASLLKSPDAKAAREFFEQNFRPVRISPLGDPNGFLTGYYEPVVDGKLQADDEFVHPLYRKPAGLLRGGRMLGTAKFTPRPTANVSTKKKTAGKRRPVPFYDRAAIDDGVLKGRNLEICYLKDPVDAFFIHIQGSVRVKLDDGKLLRLNYVAQNGHPYVAVGKFLIERNIITREAMSMEAIRQWMNANPDEGRDLRRKNKSYVFFRDTGLAADQEPVGAQGVSLTPGRSIAVDRNLHVYGTPFFIQAELPIESEQPGTRFRRLMVAQDTGGAILGPARADIYWGAGVEAGVISGRFKQPGRFVMLFPNAVDPFATMRDVPLPLPRPKNIPAALVADTKPAEVKPAVATPIAAKPAAAAPSKPADTKAKTAAATPTATAAKPAASKPASKTDVAAKKPEPKPAAKKPAPKKTASTPTYDATAAQ